MEILSNYSKFIYIILNIILLLCVYFYCRERFRKESIILVIILNLFFPFNLTYNSTYYTDGYKGMLFILLITAMYLLFFKIISKPNFNFRYIALLIILSLIIRMRFYFIILAVPLAVAIFILFAKKKNIKGILFSLLVIGALEALFFLLRPITLNDYFLIDKFSLVDIRALIENVFLFPRENPLILVLALWLVCINIIYLISIKKGLVKKELLYIIIPEIIILCIYLFLFSSGSIASLGLYLGLFPFLSLNIIYFFKYISKFSKRNRNIILVIFLLFSILELIPLGMLKDFINKII